MSQNNVTLLTTTSPATGETHPVHYRYLQKSKTWQAVLTGTGAISADVVFEVSNDNINFMSDSVSAFTMSGTTTVKEGRILIGGWNYVRASCTAISGTGATLVVKMGS